MESAVQRIRGPARHSGAVDLSELAAGRAGAVAPRASGKDNDGEDGAEGDESDSDDDESGPSGQSSAPGAGQRPGGHGPYVAIQRAHAYAAMRLTHRWRRAHTDPHRTIRDRDRRPRDRPTSARGRAAKDRDKGRRANHNRKDGALRKMSRALGPM